MFPFDYLGRWFWVLMILASLVNLVAMRFHIDKLAQGDPQKERMYTKILGVYYGASMIPFLVMVGPFWFNSCTLGPSYLLDTLTRWNSNTCRTPRRGDTIYEDVVHQAPCTASRCRGHFCNFHDV